MGKNKNQIGLKITDEQRELLEKLVGVMGGTEAEVMRNIFLAWLSEKNIIPDLLRKRIKLQ